MQMRALAAVLTGLAVSAVPVVAEPVTGVWRTEPDGKGQTGDVRFSACGSAYCGTVVEAHDSAGQPITTRNVGRKIVWSLQPAGGGTYKGRIYVPLMGQDFPTTIAVSGGQMRLKACNAVGICRTQTWSRVQ